MTVPSPGARWHGDMVGEGPMNELVLLYDPTGSGEHWSVYAKLVSPFLQELVDLDTRTVIRESLESYFSALARIPLRVRFGDECPECTGVLKPWAGSAVVAPSCEERKCPEAHPPFMALRRLMTVHPPAEHELAGDYYTRLRAMWRAGR